VPARQRLPFVDATVGARFGQPAVVRDARRRQLVTVRRSLQSVRVVRAARPLDTEQLARHAVDRDRRAFHLTNQAALAAAVAERLPLFAVQLAEGVTLPKTTSHRLLGETGRRPTASDAHRAGTTTSFACRAAARRI